MTIVYNADVPSCTIVKCSAADFCLGRSYKPWSWTLVGNIPRSTVRRKLWCCWKYCSAKSSSQLAEVMCWLTICFTRWLL